MTVAARLLISLTFFFFLICFTDAQISPSYQEAVLPLSVSWGQSGMVGVA